MNHYFVWNVDRVIFEIYGPIALRWYSIFFMAGFAFGYFVFRSWAKKEGIKSLEFTDGLLNYMVISTIVGARLGHCLFYDPNYYFSNPWKIFAIWEGGLASHGGYIGIIIGMILFTRKYNDVALWWILDRIAVLSVFAGGFIRIGNFFNSEITGRVSHVPWAIIFPKVDELPRHPTQLYESFGYFFTSFVVYLVYRAYKRTPPEGRLMGLCMILAFTFRFLVEFFKENQEPFEDAMLINMGQILSLPFIAIGIVLFFGLQKKFLSFKVA